MFHENASITLAWGMNPLEGESWTETWSENGGFLDRRIFGYYFDIRYNGVPINQDLLLSVDGARLVGIYPVSALAASVGLNVTLTSYHDRMDFGLVANAAAIDDLPVLARHTLQAYKDLTEAAGKQPAVPQRASS